MLAKRFTRIISANLGYDPSTRLAELEIARAWLLE
jgi:hypothetical protein